jgi:hypothetical protein
VDLPQTAEVKKEIQLKIAVATTAMKGERDFRKMPNE